MKYSHTRFFIVLACVVVFAVLITYLFRQIVPKYVTPYWALQILFFAIVNVVIYFIAVNVRDKNDVGRTTRFSMLVTVVKLISYIAIIAIYSIMFPSDSKAFVISFLAYYLCFSFFETFVKIKINNK